MSETTSAGPLAGITVLDFGRVVAGPFVAQVLADLGAYVIKVERPVLGDETRSYGSAERSSLFDALNRNKHSIALDLQHPEARVILTSMLERADVLIHNFRPGVMDRLGLGPQDVWEINPRVVYCAVAGFGRTGPLHTKPANDVIAQAFSGLMSFTGDAAGPPVRVPLPVADYTAGLYALSGVLAALVERASTGRGRLVETSLIEALMSLECMHIGDYLRTGALPVRLASGNLLGQPNQAFPTRDGSVVLAAVNDEMWRRCATVLGGPALADDPRYRRGVDRLRHKDELAEVVEARTREFGTDELVAAMDTAGVVCSPINDLADVAHNPQIEALGILTSCDPDGGPADMVASPLTIDGLRPAVRRGPPDLGADAADILRRLDMDDEQVASLLAGGAVAIDERRAAVKGSA